MPSLTLNKQARSLLSDLPRRGPLIWSRDGHILAQLAKFARFIVSLDGGDLQELRDGNGFHLRLNGARAQRKPWQVTVFLGTETAAIQVQPGTINNRVPTIGGIRLDAEPAPLLAIDPDAINYIYVKCSFDYTIESQAGRDVVTGITLLSAAVIASPLSASALDDPENGFFHLLIATISASGNVMAHFQDRSLAADFTINVPEIGVLVTFE